MRVLGRDHQHRQEHLEANLTATLQQPRKRRLGGLIHLIAGEREWQPDAAAPLRTLDSLLQQLDGLLRGSPHYLEPVFLKSVT